MFIGLFKITTMKETFIESYSPLSIALYEANQKVNKEAEKGYTQWTLVNWFTTNHIKFNYDYVLTFVRYKTQ
jgi:hypothetical protein